MTPGTPQGAEHLHIRARAKRDTPAAIEVYIQPLAQRLNASATVQREGRAVQPHHPADHRIMRVHANDVIFFIIPTQNFPA
jgi:hypothetical protein